MTVRLSPHGRLGVEVGSTPTRLGYVRNRAWVSPLHSGHGNWALGAACHLPPLPFLLSQAGPSWAVCTWGLAS